MHHVRADSAGQVDAIKQKMQKIIEQMRKSDLNTCYNGEGEEPPPEERNDSIDEENEAEPVQESTISDH